MEIRPVIRLLALALTIWLGAGTHPARAAIEVKEYFLGNGLQILLLEDHTAPRFMGAWAAKVGSANEYPGATGLTHLLEHMMFKGTHVLGTVDIEYDLELIEAQERQRNSMRELSEELRRCVRRGVYESLAKAQEQSPEYQVMQAEFDELVEAQKKTMVPNEFSRIYTSRGRLWGNAYTSNDYTAYFHVLPSNKLELWFWMESDRLLQPVFREFYAERAVVYEERRLRTESTPTGRHAEALNSLFWQAHPYSWPVIGWPSDVSELSLAQATEFFDTYYAANNVVLLLAGDFDPDRVLELAGRYFGRLRPGNPVPPVITMEPEQIGEKRYYGEAENNTTLSFSYHCGGFGHVDGPVIRVISALLNGETGRLERNLVRGDRLATRAYSYYLDGRYAGSFELEVEATDGVTPERLETAVLALLEDLQTEPIGDRELQKIKNNYLANSYRKEGSLMWRAFTLLGAAGRGDWREALRADEKVQLVTPGDVKRVASKMFDKNNRTVGVITRTGETVPQDVAEE